MSKQQVTFNEEENAEIEFEEEALEDDPEVYHQFLTLVDGVVGSLALLQADMDNFLYFKDELMQQFLPPNVLLQLSLLSGKVFRSYSDLQFPLWELLRLVRVYSSPWEEKKAALQKMHEDYARKKSQLEIALRRLTTQDADVKRAARERRVMNWEKLFARVQMARGHGRRWKFRMYDFKKRAALGVDHLGKYFAEDQSDLESEPESEQLGDGAEGEGEANADAQAVDADAAQLELEEKTAAAEQLVTEEFPEIELESLSDVDAHNDGEEEEVDALLREPTDIKSISMPADVVHVETADAEVWTHEPEFACTLHVRVYPARQVKARQVTVEIGFGGDGADPVRLEAQDVADRAAGDDKRRMARRRPIGGGDDDSGGGFQEASFPMPQHHQQQPPALHLTLFNERMDPAGGLAISLPQLTDAQLLTLDVDDEDDDDDAETRRQRLRMLDELSPVEYPLLLNDIEAGQLPMVLYWSRRPLHRTADRDINTASVHQLVQELTGIDLAKVTREELTREKIDACMSPRPMTPQPENIPKEEFDKLNEEFSEKFSQLEQDYIKQLKALEAQLEHGNGGAANKQQQQQQPPPGPAAETRDRATSAQRSLPSSRAASGRVSAAAAAAATDASQPQQQPAAAAKKQPVIRLPPRPVRPKKNFMVGRPLPAWGEGFPEDFFERMELLGHLTKEHKARVVARIRAEIAREVEAQLMELSRLAAATGAFEDAEAAGGSGGEEAAADEAAAQQLDEVTIPALFMPQRGEHKVYNPRAHLYFQPHGLRGARLTQPPSMLSLPPLPNRPSILNLFDLSNRASHPAAGATTISVSVPPGVSIQTQLNMMKKAAN